MTRAEAIERIESCVPQLRRRGVKSLALFGSFARDESRPESDVDVLVDFEGPATFDAYMDVKELLERVLERRVDLVTRAALKPSVKPFIERDLLHVA
jgi:uncharacterized protein